MLPGNMYNQLNEKVIYDLKETTKLKSDIFFKL